MRHKLYPVASANFGHKQALFDEVTLEDVALNGNEKTDLKQIASVSSH